MPNKFSIDSAANTAALEVYVGEVLVTIYSYDGTNILLSERPTDTTVDKSSLTAAVADIETWRDNVVRYCGLIYAFAAHGLRINDHANTIRYRMEFGAVMAIDATSTKTTQSTVFAARPALTLSPEQFNRFIRCLKVMLGQPIEGWVKW